MTDPTFGISIQRVDNEVRPGVPADMSVVGIVGTAPGADSVLFPLDTPVFMFSDDSTLLTALGTTGTIPQALSDIQDQLGEFEVAARVVVVRVADGGSTSATLTNLVGSAGSKTGIFALKEAGPLLGYIPRLITVPGYTSQQETGVASVTMGNLGTGYTSAPTVAFSGGGGSGAAGTANLTNGIALAIGAGGTGYTAAPTVTISPPPAGGVQATATVTVAGGIITGVNVTNPGTGYTALPTVTITPTNGGTGGVLTPTLTGRVGSVTITNGGSNYASAPSISFTGGGGTGAAGTPVIDQLANVVCAALPAVLDSLIAHAVVEGPATNLLGWTNWRETLNSERLIPLETAVKKGSPATVRAGAPSIIGIAVRRDHEFGGRPFHSWANQPVRGIVGPNRPIQFSLTDGATEGQTIMSQNGGIIVRGQMGVESAIASSGFIYMGTDNAGTNELWRFYNVTRGRDYIHLLFLKTLREFLGKFNLTGATIEMIKNTMEFALRDLKAQGDLLGYRVSFKRDQNSPENLRLGRFVIDFEAEEPPVLRYLGIRSARYRPALDALLDQLLSQVDTVTG